LYLLLFRYARSIKEKECEHANHYATDAVFSILWLNKLS
jgi:hypothetical protein